MFYNQDMSKKEISTAVIKRLPRYYRYLGELLEDGIERISSNELSEKMRVTASQIRQDLNNFGGFGQQGYGYNVRYLYDEIAKILGMDKKHNMIIIGAGNLGLAIAKYSNFGKRGFIIKALFDKDESLVGKEVGDITVHSMSELSEFIKNNDIEIAALTIPKGDATKIADEVVTYGVRAIWNFAHTDLRLPEHVTVENVHLSDSLMQLSYNIKWQEKE